MSAGIKSTPRQQERWATWWRQLSRWLRVQDNRFRIYIIAICAVLAVWGILLDHLDSQIGNSPAALLLTTACVGVAPELAGIVIGVVTIDYLNERRQDNQLKRQLIVQMASPHRDVSDTAVRTIRARGWHRDGSLKGAILANANLQGALLSRVVLQGAMLRGANLRGASLDSADMQGANLLGTDLEGAVLFGANLKGAQRWSVRQLAKANFVVGATMPDGTRLRVREEQARLGNIPPNPSGPTFDEWAAMQSDNIDQRAVEEALEAVTAYDEEE